ncbi:SixA phosphatase family protein [Flavobacterium sedimenticola]|mgnify:CR=1 FL=1|uniref:Histidine phosphatase family protein n=1 Tax=Flavobacterium sedimenticola TaxID=3043286 RepID=A0ABT6XPN0_9FLAO|nr:histidine phosphatase family protein [Flavobacterium sedimenticola]MDI9257051.1 histidine phosphatase family protein [Flavobacterium sedimenticola]
MKELILVRHAKSSWNAPLNDFDRPLCNRGIQDAHLVASHVGNSMPKTFLVWSSAAKRAAETAMIFAQNLSFPIDAIVFREDLYTFDEHKLERIIQSAPDDCAHLLVFGHNEAITNFVNAYGNRYIDNVATCGFVKITIDCSSWKELKKGVTEMIIFPKDLK